MVNPWKEALPKINLDKPMIIVVGGTKVPGEVYRLANHNVSIGNQPHSEVAALAIFLDSLVGELDDEVHFSNGELRVIPNAIRKQVVNIEEE
tara:strand:- start:9036 stop:9311 length:276 start_codon:yes stop_codon:yes gene_type:complete